MEFILSTININKKEAILNQLETAVDLYINDKNMVSIHTLTSAAYQIVKDIGEIIEIKKKIDSKVGIQIRRYYRLESSCENDVRKVLYSFYRKFNEKKANKEKLYRQLKSAIMNVLLGSNKDNYFARFCEALISEFKSMLNTKGLTDPIELNIDHWVNIHFIEEESKVEVKKSLRFPQNFFKHADKLEDIDSEVTFNPFFTELLLYFAIEHYWDVFEESLPIILTKYQGWFILNYPDTFKSEKHDCLLQTAKRLGVDVSNKKQYFEV